MSKLRLFRSILVESFRSKMVLSEVLFCALMTSLECLKLLCLRSTFGLDSSSLLAFFLSMFSSMFLSMFLSIFGFKPETLNLGLALGLFGSPLGRIGK